MDEFTPDTDEAMDYLEMAKRFTRLGTSLTDEQCHHLAITKDARQAEYEAEVKKDQDDLLAILEQARRR